MNNTSEFISAYMEENEVGNGEQIDLFQSTENEKVDDEWKEADIENIHQLLAQDISTEHYVEVVSYIDKLQELDEEETNEALLADLQNLKEAIELQEEEINQLNQTILNELYPFQDISPADQHTVEDVLHRYEALNTYDQQKVQGYEDVEKAATQINNLNRARYIAIGVGIVIISMSVLLVVRYRKRKKEKRRQKMIDIDE